MTNTTPRETRRSPARRGLRPTLAVVALVVLLAACQDDEPAAQVAALPTSAAPTITTGSPSVAPTTTPAQGRPQMRLDDTPERRAQLVAAWDQCLIANGAQADTGRMAAAAGPDGSVPAVVSVVEPIPQAAKAACTQLLPLGPPELDPDHNPHYRDDWLDFIACMRDHGVPVHLAKDTSVSPDGLTYTYDSDDAPIPDDQAQIEQDCTMTVFGGQ